MSHASPIGGHGIPPFDSLRFKAFPVSWVGPHPFQNGFCFGSEDGKLLFTDEVGNVNGTGQGSRSGEAINGLAHSGRWIAVTTRSDITFWGLIPNSTKLDAASVPVGAHGVTVTSDGHFVFAAGRLGLLSARPTGNPGDSVTATNTDRAGMSFYRVKPLKNDGRDVLACALRSGGIGITDFWGAREGEHRMMTVKYPDLDIVDICVLNNTPGALAIAAVARNGTLIFLRLAEPWDRTVPVAIKFDSVVGTAYRLLENNGNHILLTSKGLYFLGGLAERFLCGEILVGAPTPMMAIPMEAVDANLCANKWLMVVMPDEVRRFDAMAFHMNKPQILGNGDFRDDMPRGLEPNWEWLDVSQSTRELVVC